MPGAAHRWERPLLVLPVLIGALLRLHPLHRPYLGIELQEMYPSNAVVAIARENWEPFALHHGGGLLTVMRAMFTIWYAIGHTTGLYADRIDLLASYARNPFPYVVAGRLLVLACALASIWLVVRLGARLGGTAAGVAGGIFLAVAFMHVRESHHVWLDVPAGTVALGAVMLALAATRSGTTAAMAATGFVAGIALAAKHSTFPLALPVLLAVWWGGSPGTRARRTLVAGVATLAAFAMFSPYGIIKLRETAALLGMLHAILFGTPGASLSLVTCLHLGLGIGISLLAVVGAAWLARTAPRTAAIAIAFPLGYLLVLARESLLYARYVAVLAPFAAVFAGLGAAALGRLLPRRPAFGVAALTVAVAAAPAVQSAEYDVLLARRDTRQIAGDWIRANIPPGTAVALPNAVPYPNPVLPMDAFRLRLTYPEFAEDLRRRGIADPARTWPASYLGFFDTHSPRWEPRGRWIVTATHPVVHKGMNPPPEYLAKLEAASARPVARFDAFREPIPASVVYEPVEADYVPLTGFRALDRPGPNLIVWELPAPR
jgi:hypothetical protein